MKKILIILSIIFVIVGGYFVYNSILKKNQNNLKEELKNIISFSTLSQNNSTYIVATIDGEEDIFLLDVTIYDGGVKYDFYDSKLYLYLYKFGEENSTLGYIDLSNKAEGYELSIISTIKLDGYPTNFAVLDDSIYLSSINSLYISKYDLKGNKIENTSILNNDKYSTTIYSLDKENLIINKNMDIILLDSKTKENITLDINGRIEYLFNNKIVFYKYINEQDNDKWIYYEYDFYNNVSKMIGDPVSGNRNTELYNIIPIDKGYIYVDQKDIYKYKDNNQKRYILLKAI